MRELATEERIERFFVALGKVATSASRVYVTGGVSAVLLGFRPTTLDVDLKLHPESDEILRAIPKLKEELRLNVELAAPDQFIPPLPGWQTRSRFIRQEGKLDFYHYDFYAQVLAKLERGHRKDLLDVTGFLAAELVERERLLELFGEIEGDLYLYPALDPVEFRRAVEEFVRI